MKDYTIYVTKEIARKAMDKGFELKKTSYSDETNKENKLIYIKNPNFTIFNGEIPGITYFLPTSEQICGWLREEHNVEVSISRNRFTDYPYKVIAYVVNKEDYSKVETGYDYEDTLLRGINKALDLI